MERTKMIPTHGGILIDQVLSEKNKDVVLAKDVTRIAIGERYVSDCEMIGVGAFSPLTGFMTKQQVKSVVSSMRLPSDLLWPIPIMLPVGEDEWNAVNVLDEVILTDESGREIALLKISEKYTIDLDEVCEGVFKTTEDAHPGVAFLRRDGNHFLAGQIELIQSPKREGIGESYYLTPAQTREMFKEKGWKSVVAFQTRNPIHRAHEYITKCALEAVDGLLIHPVVGEQKADDIPAEVRMQCYETLIESYYNPEHALLSVLPYAMRYAGPREAILHFIIRQNYGITHMIIGRDHAGVGDYYGTYEAQELLDTVLDDLHITPMKFEHSFYCKKCDAIITQKTCPHSKEDYIHLSGTKVREMLKNGEKPPVQFSRDEIANILLEWAQNAK